MGEFYIALIIGYASVAVVASLFYGWKAVEIFTEIPKKPKEEQPHSAWWWHQRWLNFAGSLAGWVVLWILIKRYLPHFTGQCEIILTYWDVIGAVVAFIGITGYLPFTIIGLLSGAMSTFDKIAKLISEKMGIGGGNG